LAAVSGVPATSQQDTFRGIPLWYMGIVATCMLGQVLHEKKEFTRRLFHQHALRVSFGAVHANIAITWNKMGNMYCTTKLGIWSLHCGRPMIMKGLQSNLMYS
jgi:hypothetical protein